MNAPNDAIDQIIKVLPGMKSPTVMPLADEGWSSVHTVIREDDFWDIIEELRGCWCRGYSRGSDRKDDSMKTVINPAKETWAKLLKRPTVDLVSIEALVKTSH